MTEKQTYDDDWATYLDNVERLHGVEARKVAERQGSALAGEAANIRGRQRMSWRQKHLATRRR